MKKTITTFMPLVGLFVLYAPKISKNLRFVVVFRVYTRKIIAWNGSVGVL